MSIYGPQLFKLIYITIRQTFYSHDEATQSRTLSSLQKMPEPTESVIIVGAGIVGSSLAYFLSVSQSATPRKITLIDRSFTSLLGSSGIAPGFIGQFNESEVLTKLAIDSVSEYVKIPGGFDRVGGLEIAFEEAGIQRLRARC